jgi:hypothetical protein
MTQHCGIDTSVLVRLATAEPEADFQHCVSELRALLEEQDAEIFASNQVIGEAYIDFLQETGLCIAVIHTPKRSFIAGSRGLTIIDDSINGNFPALSCFPLHLTSQSG